MGVGIAVVQAFKPVTRKIKKIIMMLLEFKANNFLDIFLFNAQLICNVIFIILFFS